MPLSLPSAFTDRMRQQLGDEFEDFLAALEEQAPTSLRLNAKKAGAAFEGSSEIPWATDGVYLAERPSFFKNPLIYAGAFYVQEASSMLIGQAGFFEEDIAILDLCAAPGGKSTLLASEMTEGSFLVSNELVRNRAAVLEENLSRWGNPNVAITCNHPRDYEAVKNVFDLIVVDAPCSGEGMFRKDPKSIGHWTPRAMHDCADRQKEILGFVMDALKPGGRLVYSTCTYNPFENEDIVQWLLDSGQFEIVPLEFPSEWGLTPGTTKGYSPKMKHTFHCYPHKVKGEGFFLSCLQKKDDGAPRSLPSKKKAKKQHKKQHAARPNLEAANRKQTAELSKWMKTPEDFDFFILADTAFAISKAWSSGMREQLDSLYLIKMGIKMGEFKRDTLVPAHDLAMSELQADSIPTTELTEEQALRYLKRVELNQDAPDWLGWGIVQYQGRNLGWIKALKGRINNHFPKEMRIRSDVGLD